VSVSHRVTYKPLRVSDFDARLGCFVTRIVGYRAVCSCGARGKVCSTVAASRLAPVEHVAAAPNHEALTSSDD